MLINVLLYALLGNGWWNEAGLVILVLLMFAALIEEMNRRDNLGPAPFSPAFGSRGAERRQKEREEKASGAETMRNIDLLGVIIGWPVVVVILVWALWPDKNEEDD